MSQWVLSARTALSLSLFAFALLWVPTLVLQFRRWGGWSPMRFVGSFVVSLYGAALISYTLLPLPPMDSAWCAKAHTEPQLVPFHMFSDFSKEMAAGGSLLVAIMQVVFNVVLFVPWGVIVRRYYHWRGRWAVLSGGAISLLIEATQGTGMWGMYACSYRVADIDDLIANTTGAFIGALLAPALLWWVPRSRELAARRLRPRPITCWRRWFGQLVDIVLYALLLQVLTIVVMSAMYALGYNLAGQQLFKAGGSLMAWSLTAAALATWVIMFAIPPLIGRGASPGQTAVWLAPVRHGAEGAPETARDDGAPAAAGRVRRLVRANILALPVTVLTVVGAWKGQPYQGVLAPLVLLIALMVPLTRTCRGLSCLLTGLELVDVRGAGVRPGAQDRQGAQGSGPDPHVRHAALGADGPQAQ